MTPAITDPATAPTVAPVVGKRARLRNGEIVGPIHGDAWRCGYKPDYPVYADGTSVGRTAWAANGGFYSNKSAPHDMDIIAILDDDVAPSEVAFDLRSGCRAAEPEPQAEAEVTPITGYEFGDAHVFVGARIYIRHTGDTVALTPAEARALLQVLPGLIKIAEGR